jgi:hypothetical protein
MDFCGRIQIVVECLDLIVVNYKDTLKPEIMKSV